MSSTGTALFISLLSFEIKHQPQAANERLENENETIARLKIPGVQTKHLTCVVDTLRISWMIKMELFPGKPAKIVFAEYKVWKSLIYDPS